MKCHQRKACISRALQTRRNSGETDAASRRQLLRSTHETSTPRVHRSVNRNSSVQSLVSGTSLRDLLRECPPGADDVPVYGIAVQLLMMTLSANEIDGRWLQVSGHRDGILRRRSTFAAIGNVNTLFAQPFAFSHVFKHFSLW